MIDLPVQALRISIPYVLAALGGTLSERSGVVNIALEGMMLCGAFGAVAGTLATGNPWLGLLIGVMAGALLGGTHALMTGVFRADHIVSGLALNLLAAGATRVLLQRWYHSASNSPRVEGIESLIEGGALVRLVSHPLVWVTVALVAGVAWMLSRSVLGLRWTAAGEHPKAAEAAGVPVRRLRALAVACSGGLAGLAGVWLAFDQHQFTDGMSGGRGYIALAAMIFGRWMPARAALACLFFGLAEAIQMGLQGGAVTIPVQFVQMIPYVVTLVALAGAMGRSRPPAALGRALDG